MPLTVGSVFLAGALLSCLLPISLLISFATFFYRQTRKLPANVGGKSSATTAPAPTQTPEPPAQSSSYAGQ